MKLKVPYFKQEKETNCGVACLRMVAAFHEKEVSELDLEDSCETSWLGNTCSELIHGIEKYGFEAEEVEHITIDYLVSILTGNSPMIALIDPAVLYGGLEGFGHFVVIIGLEGDKIWYHDPDLKGDLMRNVSDFMQAWRKLSCKGVRIWKSTKR